MPDLQHGEIVHAEHLVRYRLAAQLASGRRVLDVACGEGYGTALLAAAGARSATGLDVDEVTVSHARSRHPGPTFIVADVQELPFEDASFDLVVCFETIEHVDDADRVLAELKRVLAQDGLLLVSTPNKHQYLVENEFHRREFFHEEFVELLRERLGQVELLLQHNWLASAVLPVSLAADASADRDLEIEVRKLIRLAPGGELYTIALCGDGDLPRMRGAAVAAGMDEAHDLARRTVEAERTAEMWHGEYTKAVDQLRASRQALFDAYASIWWRMTSPLRWLADFVRGRGG
jgi:ubiquinone/menaquinone biosynthesis C-methylase UbiE